MIHRFLQDVSKIGYILSRFKDFLTLVTAFMLSCVVGERAQCTAT